MKSRDPRATLKISIETRDSFMKTKPPYLSAGEFIDALLDMLENVKRETDRKGVPDGIVKVYDGIDRSNWVKEGVFAGSPENMRLLHDLIGDLGGRADRVARGTCLGRPVGAKDLKPRTRRKKLPGLSVEKVGSNV